MEFLYRALAISFAALSLLASPSHSSFSPADYHLVNCGSAGDAVVENRRFASDRKKSPFCHSDSSSTSLRSDVVSSDSADLYDTARVFVRPSKYEFEISERGRHTVRLHFSNLISPKFDPKSSQFHVVIDEFVVLSNFTTANSPSPMVKEYLVSVNSDKLVIRFSPSDPSKFAFVNAIEVVSAPKDLVPSTAQFVNTEKVENSEIPPSQALEVVHRVNVGGPKVTPFNGSLWRTWLPDDEFLQSSFGSESVYFGGRIKYQIGGSSREIAPDNVYNSARLIRSHTDPIPRNVNMTWEFPVEQGFKHLVRMHFCDIASISLELMYFNVYVNGKLTVKDWDLSNATNWMLASPIYRDFVVDDSDESGVITVTVGPSSSSIPYAIVGILNGVEIMKMSNSAASLDGPDEAGLVLGRWAGQRDGFGSNLLVPLIAAACVVLSLSILLRRKIVSSTESVGAAWSRLPVEVSESSPKFGV